MSTFIDGGLLAPEPGRRPFLWDLYEVLSGDILRSWCLLPQSPYDCLKASRVEPTTHAGAYHASSYPIGWALRHRVTGKTYVAHQASDLRADWALAVRVAQRPAEYAIVVGDQRAPAAGTILVLRQSRSDFLVQEMKSRLSLADILSVEDMVADLRDTKPRSWAEAVGKVRKWSVEFCDFLLGRPAMPHAT